jgi:hypothetical protein
VAQRVLLTPNVNRTWCEGSCWHQMSMEGPSWAICWHQMSTRSLWGGACWHLVSTRLGAKRRIDIVCQHRVSGAKNKSARFQNVLMYRAVNRDVSVRWNVLDLKQTLKRCLGFWQHSATIVVDLLQKTVPSGPAACLSLQAVIIFMATRAGEVGWNQVGETLERWTPKSVAEQYATAKQIF